MNVQPSVVNAVTGIISYSSECNRLVMLIDATRVVIGQEVLGCD